MAGTGLWDKQAEIYLDARPNYPPEWYSRLAGLTLHHRTAWDVGTGNGQAAIGIAEHYDRVIATDISESLLKLAMPHPKVTYNYTPVSMTDDELVDLIGGENSVDLITVASAIHWFDLPKFYAVATRLLRKPGGIIAVWSYSNTVRVCPEFDAAMSRFNARLMPFWKFPNMQYVFDAYKTLPFPFEGMGLGTEGEPFEQEMEKKVSFEGFIRLLRSFSSVVTAKEKGVDLLSESGVAELETAWGGAGLVRSVVYNIFILVGKVKV